MESDGILNSVQSMESCAIESSATVSYLASLGVSLGVSRGVVIWGLGDKFLGLRPSPYLALCAGVFGYEKFGAEKKLEMDSPSGVFGVDSSDGKMGYAQQKEVDLEEKGEYTRNPLIAVFEAV